MFLSSIREIFQKNRSFFARPEVVQVRPVRRWRDRPAFMNFAWDLYHNDPIWIPPLRDNLKRLLGWKYHPFQEIGEVQTFLARRNGEVVGRIAGIVNR